MKHKEIYYWYCQIGGWGLFVLIYTFFYFTQRTNQSDYPYYFHVIIFEAGTGLAVTHILRQLVKEANVLSLPIFKQVALLFVITISLALVYNTLVVVVEHVKGWEPVGFEGVSFLQKWFRTLLGSLLYFTIWSLLYFAYHYVYNTQKQRINQIRLEATVKELELKTIKAHINPHFIFNALNSIRALVDENPQRARTAITELSQLLRSSMNAEKDEQVPLDKELAIVKNYLALEQIRFEDRLKVEINIGQQSLRQQVPPMMLQTLVENAIKHGISKEMLGGTVNISTQFLDGHHLIVIKNTGKLTNAMGEPGFGLASTRNRLQLLYGSSAYFEIKQLENNEVEAKLAIPLNA